MSSAWHRYRFDDTIMENSTIRKQIASKTTFYVNTYPPALDIASTLFVKERMVSWEGKRCIRGKLPNFLKLYVLFQESIQ